MATEIERKFLVNRSLWTPSYEGVSIAQGYLSLDPFRTVRVRTKGERGFLTVKGKTEGISRAEFEYEIPLADALNLLKLCTEKPIEKTRYTEELGGFTWEIDVFHGVNNGLILAEVELDQVDEKPQLPQWIGEEVSFDVRYFNAYLYEKPYTTWPL